MALPSPRRIGHLRSVFWWIVLLLAAATYYAESVVVSSRRVTPPPPGTEREAFFAVSFGEVADRALGGLSALGATVEGWARRPGFDGRLSPAIQDFGDVYAVEGDRPRLSTSRSGRLRW